MYESFPLIPLRNERMCESLPLPPPPKKKRRRKNQNDIKHRKLNQKKKTKARYHVKMGGSFEKSVICCHTQTYGFKKTIFEFNHSVR